MRVLFNDRFDRKKKEKKEEEKEEEEKNSEKRKKGSDARVELAPLHRHCYSHTAI